MRKLQPPMKNINPPLKIEILASLPPFGTFGRRLNTPPPPPPGKYF